MKKQKIVIRLLCLGLSLLLILSVAACKDQADEQESQPPTATIAPTDAPTPTPTPPPEISVDELHRQFELIYNNCGADITQSEEQIANELEALKASAADSDEIWPDNYEELYLSWRTNTIAKWMNNLKMSYWQIIDQRELGGIGKQVLIYADYIDSEQGGTPKLMLLSWLGKDGDYGYDHIITLELYGEENGQAVEWWKQDIIFNFTFNEMAKISVASRDGQLFLSAYYSDSRGSGYLENHDFYALNRESNGDADKFSYYYDRTDDSERYSHGGSGISSDEYQTQLNAYQTGEDIASINMETPIIWANGILTGKNEIYATLEVDGIELQLSRNPYVYGSPYGDIGAFMVPIRDTLEAMGVAVGVNEDVSMILASTKNDTLVITNKDLIFDNDRYDYYQYSFNGGELTYAFVENYGGFMYAPLQTLIPLFGAQAEWSTEDGIIRINGSVAASERMSDAEVKAMANFSLEDAIKIGEQNGHSFYGIQVAYIGGGHYISHGKAIWEYAVLPAGEDAVYSGEHSEGTAPSNMYYIQVASDGTITRS